MKYLPIVAVPILVLLKMIVPFYAISVVPRISATQFTMYAENMAPIEKIKLCTVDGIEPEHTSIRMPRYPITAEVYVVVRADSPPTSIVIRLRAWLLSAAGQEMVAQCGYVSIQD